MSPLINNARIGISYQTGSQSREKDELIISPYDPILEELIPLNVNYYRDLSVSVTGIHFDYAFVPFKSMAILTGIGAKLGNMTLEQYLTADVSSK
jgi:hypothetical protein